MVVACAITMAKLVLDDLSTSVAFKLRVSIEMEPGFNENGFRGSRSGNFIGN